jgi:hypothetical protein
MSRVRVEYQPFPWSVWLRYPNNLGFDEIRVWESETFLRLLNAIPEADFCLDPFMGTAAYFCVRLRDEADVTVVKLMFEGAD